VFGLVSYNFLIRDADNCDSAKTPKNPRTNVVFYRLFGGFGDAKCAICMKMQFAGGQLSVFRANCVIDRRKCPFFGFSVFFAKKSMYAKAFFGGFLAFRHLDIVLILILLNFSNINIRTMSF